MVLPRIYGTCLTHTHTQFSVSLSLSHPNTIHRNKTTRAQIYSCLPFFNRVSSSFYSFCIRCVFCTSLFLVFCYSPFVCVLFLCFYLWLYNVLCFSLMFLFLTLGLCDGTFQWVDINIIVQLFYWEIWTLVKNAIKL